MDVGGLVDVEPVLLGHACTSCCAICIDEKPTAAHLRGSMQTEIVLQDHHLSGHGVDQWQEASHAHQGPTAATGA